MYTAGKEKMPRGMSSMASLLGSVQLPVFIVSVLSDCFRCDGQAALTAVCHGVYAGNSLKQLDLFIHQCKAHIAKFSTQIDILLIKLAILTLFNHDLFLAVNFTSSIAKTLFFFQDGSHRALTVRF